MLVKAIKWGVAFTFLMWATYCYALAIYGVGLGIMYVWSS
jgi:hypothetical protein